MGAPPPWPHPKRTYLSKFPPANTITLNMKDSTYEWWGDRNIRSVAGVYSGGCKFNSWHLSLGPKALALCASEVFASGARFILNPDVAKGQRECQSGLHLRSCPGGPPGRTGWHQERGELQIPRSWEQRREWLATERQPYDQNVSNGLIARLRARAPCDNREKE